MRFKIRGSGFGVQFSPFVSDKIVVCSSQNFGIVGRGYASVYHFTPTQLNELVTYETKDCLFDCCWNEIQESVFLAASADGLICLYDTADSIPDAALTFNEHGKEVACIKWNQQRNDKFISASWDGTAKLWTPSSTHSLQTFIGHRHSVYSLSWNVSSPSVFVTASGDQTLKIWDDRDPNATLSWVAHQNEVLCVDWCKYNENLVVSGSVDKLLRLWDVRQTHEPLQELIGHRYAVKRCLFSPHSPNLILSASYDMSVRLWDLSQPIHSQSRQRIWEHHTEFVSGIDFSNHEEGRVVSVGWDESLNTWNVNAAN